MNDTTPALPLLPEPAESEATGGYTGDTFCPAHPDYFTADQMRAYALQSIAADRAAREGAPVDMVLHCPACGLQHIDAPESAPEAQPDGTVHNEEHWTNPPHRSHLCHGCGHVWRPADVPTNGVSAVKTKGKNDSPLAAPRGEAAAQPGWVLVPVEITEAMHQAAVRTIFRCNGNDDFPPRVWRAMLAASPEPAAAPQQPQGEREAVAHLTDDQIAGAWDRWPKTSITSRAAAVSFVRHVLAAAPPPPARETERELIASSLCTMRALSACRAHEPNSLFYREAGRAIVAIELLCAALAARPAEGAEITDFQLESLFDAVHEHGQFGREFREHARQILAAQSAEPDEYEFHINELPRTADGSCICAASGSGPSLDDVLSEAAHYAAQYAQDGDIQVKIFAVYRREIDAAPSVSAKGEANE